MSKTPLESDMPDMPDMHQHCPGIAPSEATSVETIQNGRGQQRMEMACRDIVSPPLDRWK